MTAIATKERPILMCGPMVRATLDDWKTQTRRVIALREFGPSDTPGYHWHFRDRRGLWNDISTERLLELCPHGAAGTRLWVRERWGKIHGTDAGVIYRADGPHDGIKEWKPSIFMPRWASRILLEITGVRVQRVQEISEEDARAEGVREVTKDDVVKKYCVYDLGDRSSVPWAEMPRTAVDAYRALWETINGEGSWAKNPWVWILGFKRIT